MGKGTLQLQASAFDDLASDYDASFTHTALGARLRDMVWRRLDAAFAGCSRVLEIGCGTGEDAIHLAGRGLEVWATDASMPMLRVAEQKAERTGLAGRVHFRCVPMERLGAALAREKFDGVFSNFGAVNCVQGLEHVVADLAPLIEPGAPLVWVVMGRNVPWEWAWFLARGDWRKAFRRRSEGGLAWRGTRVSYPSPAELERTLSPHFVTVRRHALGVVLPPSYAGGWLERSPRTLESLARIERLAQRWEPLAALGDHYILEARRRDVRANA